MVSCVIHYIHMAKDKNNLRYVTGSRQKTTILNINRKTEAVLFLILGVIFFIDNKYFRN